MIIKMNSKLILVFSVLLISFQSQGQKMNDENNLYDDTLAINCVNFIKTKALDYNKELYPVPCTDLGMLIDSLWKENTSYLVSHFSFSEQDPVIRNISPNLGQLITNERRMPFLLYKLDKFPNGKYMLTIVQGHLN